MGKKNNAGMTLIEVLVAVIVFTLVATPLVSVFSYCLRMERRALVHALTTYTAQMKMEEAYGMDGLAIMDCYNDDFTEDMDLIALRHIYTATLYVPDDDTEIDYESLNLYEITITVRNEFYDVETTLENILPATS